MNSFVICCIRQINNKPIKYLKERNAAQAPVNSFSKSLYALPSVFWNHLPPVRLKKGYLSGVWATGGQPLRGFWRKVNMEYLVFAPHNFQLVPENQDMAWSQGLQETSKKIAFLFTCMHLTVSPRDLLPPTELLPWTNDLQMYQIYFFLLKINFEIVFLLYQLFPDSCVTVLISLCSSSPFCSKRIILRISFPKYLLKYLLDVKLSCFQCWCPLRGASFSSNWWSRPCKEGTKWVHVLRRKINQRGQWLQQKQGEESQLNGNCQHRKVITTMLRFIRTATVINNVRKNKNDLKWKSPNQQNWRKFIVKNNTALSS